MICHRETLLRRIAGNRLSEHPAYKNTPPKRGKIQYFSSRFGFLINCRFRDGRQGLIRRFLFGQSFLKKLNGVV
jgi:hypothetical protein